MASSVQQFDLDESYRCGYCYQLKNNLDDPRVLPCKHVFCFSCVCNDYRKGSTLECPVCRVKHNNLIVSDLPRYFEEKGAPCHVCGKIPKTHSNQSSIFVCTEHAVTSDEISASSTLLVKNEEAIATSAGHNVIRMEDNVFCTQHTDEEIKRACSTCYKGLCMECTLSGKCNQDKSHSIEKIQSFSERLKKELMQIMNELQDRSSVLSELEKEAYVILADHGKAFEEMKAFVDKVTEEQIKEIQEKAVKIKLAVDEVFQDSTDTVRKYCTELMAKKEASDGFRRDIDNLINYRTDLEVIQDYKKILKPSADIFASIHFELPLPVITVKKLAEHREVEVEISPGSPKIVRRSLQSFISEIKKDPEVEIPLFLPKSFVSGTRVKKVLEPKELVHISSSAIGCVYSVNWLPNNELACGFRSKLEIRDSLLKNIKYLSMGLFGGYVYTVHKYGTDYLLLVYSNGEYKLNHYTSDFTNSYTVIGGIFGRDSCHMAVKENNVLIIDNNSKVIKLFRYDGTHVLDIDCKMYISRAYGIQFQEDNSFIVSDSGAGKVLKFRMEADSAPQWTCDGLSKPKGIAIDTSGLIYVAGEAKTIYILTPSGMLLKQLSPPELYDNLRSLSISGNDLAVGSNSGVQMFNITY